MDTPVYEIAFPGGHKNPEILQQDRKLDDEDCNAVNDGGDIGVLVGSQYSRRVNEFRYSARRVVELRFSIARSTGVRLPHASLSTLSAHNS